MKKELSNLFKTSEISESQNFNSIKILEQKYSSESNIYICKNAIYSKKP